MGKQLNTQNGYTINLNNSILRRLILDELIRRWDSMNDSEQIEWCKYIMENNIETNLETDDEKED